MTSNTLLSALRLSLVRLRYGWRGVPFSAGRERFRLDERLKGWRADSEAQLWSCMDAALGPGDLAVDVGANFGLHTLYAARRVGQSGCVYAFEPVEQNLRLLRRNVELNGLGGVVQIVPKAVSGSDASELEFFVPEESVAVTAGLRPPRDGGKAIRVPNVRLDDVTFPPGRRVRLVKIDVEGGEVGVLKGASRVLRSDRPTLLIEVHGFALPAFGTSVAELRGILSALGYQETRLGGSGSDGDEYYQARFDAGPEAS